MTSIGLMSDEFDVMPFGSSGLQFLLSGASLRSRFRGHCEESRMYQMALDTYLQVYEGQRTTNLDIVIETFHPDDPFQKLLYDDKF